MVGVLVMMNVTQYQTRNVENSVIFVDDESELADEVVQFGAWKGFNISHAQNALCCLDQLRTNEAVDVVITDMRLPDLSGIELIRTIRSEFSERIWLQFIVLTGYADLDVAQAAIRLGAIDLLSKPFDGIMFLAALNRGVLRSKKLRRQVPGYQNADREEIEGMTSSKSGPPNPASDALRECVKQISRLRSQRSELFPTDLFADPCWDMLLELYLAELQNRTVTTSSLCLASRVPVSTALRRVAELERRKFIERQKDSIDGRRSVVTLSDMSRRLLRKYFARCGNVIV